MTKEKLQQELKEKVREGIKPSHLKKLKRSKSADDIPSAPPSPTLKIKQLEDKVSVLELEIEVKAREIVEKDLEIKELKKNPPNLLLTDQLKAKQKEVESLRQQLEKSNTELTTLKKDHSTLLDTNLILKHQALKDWWEQYQKTNQLDKELTENIEEASTELINQDKFIEKLSTENKQLKLTNQSLQKDLQLATKLAELRKNPLPENNSYSNLLIYGLVAIGFISLLNASWKTNFKTNE